MVAGRSKISIQLSFIGSNSILDILLYSLYVPEAKLAFRLNFIGSNSVLDIPLYSLFVPAKAFKLPSSVWADVSESTILHFQDLQ
jgi:hypothetical protein